MHAGHSSPRRVGAAGALLALVCAVLVPVSRAQSPEGPSEADLLRAAARYLRITRTQAGHLLRLAAYTHRYLVQLRMDEERDARSRTPPTDAAIAERRDGLRNEISSYVAPRLVRILTREQVALAYRLAQGNPPKYAAADPVLLHPDAGFVTMRQGIRLRGAPGAGEGLVLEGAAPRVSGGRLLLLDRPSSNRPFAQMVVETSNPDELSPLVTAFAWRAFGSEDWLGVVREGARKGFGIRLPRAVERRVLVREYRMDRGLHDVRRRGPELAGMGGAIDHGQYVFGPGQGLQIPDLGVTDDYDLEIQFRFQDVSGGYQKILDFQGQKTDDGLYAYQGAITFYTLAVGGRPLPNQEHRLRLVRDRHTRIVRAYLDLQPIFAFLDLDDTAVFQNRKAVLFADDRQTQGEQGPGTLRWLRVRGPA